MTEQQQQQQTQQTQQQQEIDLGEFLKGESPQTGEPVAGSPQPLPKPICTNEQFVQMVHGILRDVVAGDLPDEVIVQLPSPHLLKVFLDIIRFEDASGLLGNLVSFDPQRTLWLGLGATGVYSAYFVIKAVNIKKAMQKQGIYQQAMSSAAERRRAEYEKILSEMGDRPQTEEPKDEVSNNGEETRVE